jgi:hypothetical protein
MRLGLIHLFPSELHQNTRKVLNEKLLRRSGPASVDQTVSHLRSQGYQVILN